MKKSRLSASRRSELAALHAFAQRNLAAEPITTPAVLLGGAAGLAEGVTQILRRHRVRNADGSVVWSYGAYEEGRWTSVPGLRLSVREATSDGAYLHLTERLDSAQASNVLAQVHLPSRKAIRTIRHGRADDMTRRSYYARSEMDPHGIRPARPFVSPGETPLRLDQESEDVVRYAAIAQTLVRSLVETVDRKPLTSAMQQ